MKKTAAIVIGGLLLPASAQAGLYWNHDVRDAEISVCFVGNALTARPDRVNEILQDIQEYEYAANVRFDFWGTCPEPETQRDGTDWFDGDIRVIVPGIDISAKGMVPGEGCPMFLDDQGNYNGENSGWGSWSNAPDDLEPNRPCLYNLKLGDDPWNSDPYLNHTLHEFGHALGLAHEHKRADVDLECTEDGYGGSATSYMTGYDDNSIMHYKFSSCGIDGNYGTDGLSSLDRLAVHMLYPEAVRVAELVGTTVVRTTDTVRLQSAWTYRGAYSSKAMSQLSWKVGGVQLSSSADLVTSLGTAGLYSLSFNHQDFLGRSYSYNGLLRVLTPTEFAKQIAGPVAATLM